jgi:hypothetical protein
MNCFTRNNPTGIASSGSIWAKKLSIRPSPTTVRYLGIVTAIGTNIRASVFTAKINFLPLKSFFDKTYPAAAEITIDKTTTITVDSILLNRYLEAGTFEVLAVVNSLIKFSKVGRFVINLGGYTKSSSIGLMALKIIKSIGKIINTIIGSRII